jgi:hypothetical protein
LASKQGPHGEGVRAHTRWCTGAVPAFLWRNLKVLLPLAVLNAVAYLLLNHHPPREPVQLPLTAVDRATPFLVWTVWAYAVLLLCDVALPMFIRDFRVFNDAVRAFAVALVLHVTAWSLMPTAYPRPPLPQGDSLSERFYRLLISTDTPLCAFPSSHIAIPALALWALSREHPRYAVLLWGGFALLAPCILTTKQHYVVDLFGGLAVAAISISVSMAVRRYSFSQQQRSRPPEV